MRDDSTSSALTSSQRSVTRRDALAAFGLAAAATLVGGADGVAAAAPTGSTRAPRRGRLVVVDARPAPITIDTARTALIVVDMQNDFGSKGGMFDQLGIDVSMIQRVVDPIARTVAAARDAGLRVVYLKMAFRPDLSDLGAAGSPNREGHLRAGVGKPERTPNGEPSRTLIRDMWGTDIVKELTPRPEDLVVYKHRFSGFFQTDLDERLRRMGVEYLVVTGCTTSVCVESTVRDAMFRDYSPIVLSDCTAEPVGHDLPRSNHEASLFAIQSRFGWVSTSGCVTSALGGKPTAAASSKP